MSTERWQKLDRVFVEALQAPPANRGEVVARACAGDEALERESRSLLSAADQSGEFLARPAYERLADAIAADGWSLHPGERVGAYTVHELVGSGGAGEVWRATDERLGRDVAIKVLLPHLSTDPDRVRLFLDEARTAGSLNHASILAVYDVGDHCGAPFIVCEYVEGESLRTRLQAGPLSVDAAVAVALQIARGLAAAHARGIIHRDLKPENVFLRADGGVKVLDFGLATLTDGSHSASGLVAGTAGYMAPEQANGAAVDPRADLFSLGATLYEMLAGERAFKGASTLETLQASLTVDPPDLAVHRHVPPAVAAIVKRLLEKQADARFQSAADVAQALERVAAAPRPGARSSRFARRLTVAGIAMLAAGAMALTAWWRAAPLSDTPVALGAGGRPAIAVMSFANGTGASDMAWLSTGVPNMLLTSLAQTPGLDIVSAQRVNEALEQAGQQDLVSIDRRQIADVARRAGAGAVVVGSVYKSGDEIRIDAQVEDLASGRVLSAESVRGSDVFALVDELTVRIRDGVGLDNAPGLRRIADVSTTSVAAYRRYSEGVDAAENLRWNEAVALLEQATDIDPAFAEAHLRLAMAYHGLGRHAAWREHLDNASEHASKLSERNRLMLELQLASGPHGDVGRRAQLLDELVTRFPDVEETYAFATELYHPASGATPNLEKLLALTRTGATVLPESGQTRNAYGYALLSAGQFAAAAREFEAYARISPREPNPFDSLGEAYVMLGSPDKAVDAYSRALAIDPAYPSGNGRAYALAMLGRYEEALAAEPSLPHLRALVLSRMGRYGDAARAIQAGLARAVADQNMLVAGGLGHMSAMLALERRDYPRALSDSRLAREYYVRARPGSRQMGSLASDTLAALADLGAGRIGRARARLDAQKGVYRPAIELESWHHHALAAEIALAAGDVATAAARFTAGRPTRRVLTLAIPGSVVTNNLWLRDGLARVAEARGDLAGAVQIYRRLLAPDAEEPFVSVHEPRYVLQIARLLDRSGDRQGAQAEYRRFLELWKDADADLPELAEARRALDGSARSAARR